MYEVLAHQNARTRNESHQNGGRTFLVI